MFLGFGLWNYHWRIVIGKIMDRNYRLLKEKLVREPGLLQADQDPAKRLPLKKTSRLKGKIQDRTHPTLDRVACCAGYGWCLHQKVNIAVPLVLQFACCFSAITILNTTQTLLVDLLPAQSSSVTA
ncbi:hypothetical protein EV401DRAFT_705346 [Pisolithus croceorrhizus]|nr:hypothetical protein EV401DRAFT_705346 [Pisolithus croceorrhizus]